MLLELITGQRAFDLAHLANDDDVRLLDWIKGLPKEKRLELLVDPDLKNNYIEVEVESLFYSGRAALCTQGSPLERPKMSEVVRRVEDDELAERLLAASGGGTARGWLNQPASLNGLLTQMIYHYRVKMTFVNGDSGIIFSFSFIFYRPLLYLK